MAIQEQMERALEGGDTGSALDTLRLMEQERSTVGEPVAAVAAREKALRQRQPLQPWDNPQAAPTPAPAQEEIEQVKVKLPSGEDVLVTVPVGLPDSEVVSRLKAMGELPPDPAGTGSEPERYRLGAALQGATIGTGDEWTAAITAAAAKAATWLPGEQAGEDSSYGEIYNDILDAERAKLAEYQKAYPVESTAIEVGGAIAPALFSGGTTAPATIGRLTATGAAWGGLYGAGTATPDKETTTLEQLQERGKEAAKGAAIGAVGGAAIGGAAKGVGKIAQNRAAKKVEKRMGTLEGRQSVLDEVNEEVTTRIANGEPRLQAVKATLKSKNIPAKKSRDLMIQNSGPIGWGKNQKTAMDELVASADVANNTIIMGSIPLLDYVIRPISTRIERWSPAVAQKLRNYEAKTHFDYHDWRDTVEPFMEHMHKIGKGPARAKITQHLYNGRFDEARALMREQGGEQLVRDFKIVEDLLAEIRKRMRAVGIKDSDLPNYFPRVVANLKGLKKHLGTDQLTGVDAYLRRVKDPVRAMEMYMKANPKVKERSLRSRKVAEIDDETLPYYMDLLGSLDRHLKESTTLIRRREFLGKHRKVNDKGAEDVASGIQSMIDDMMEIPTAEGRDEVAKLLKARFVPGERNMYGWLQNIRNIGHTALLANPVSATTQLADLGPTAWVYGLGRTAMSTVKNTTGKGKVSFDAEDLGVMRQMVQELNEQGAGATTKLLEFGLEKSGFKMMDKFGKDAIITSAYDKAARMARSFHGKKQLMKDLKPSWGNETGELISDLATGKQSELVRLYLFTQLSKMQPVTKTEMPQLYLEMPNGRILYQLLSWTIKQMDVMRQETGKIAQQVLERGGMKKSPFIAAKLAKHMAAGFLMVGGMGVASDEAKRFISGKESAFQGVGNRPTDLGERMMEQMTKAMFKNYVGDHDVGRAVDNYLQIGVPTGDISWKLYKKAAAAADQSLNPVERAEAMEELQRESMGLVPIVGKLYAMWIMGGAQEFNLKERETRRKEYLEKYKY